MVDGRVGVRMGRNYVWGLMGLMWWAWVTGSPVVCYGGWVFGS